jgi:hypothetical protein
VSDREADQPVGPLLDALGVTIELDANQQLTEAIVLAKVVDFADNTTGLVIGASVGLDWISQRGIVSAAQHILDDCSCQNDD